MMDERTELQEALFYEFASIGTLPPITCCARETASSNYRICARICNPSTARPAPFDRPFAHADGTGKLPRARFPSPSSSLSQRKNRYLTKAAITRTAMTPVTNHPIPIPNIIPLFIMSLMIANPPRTCHRLHSLKFLATTRHNRQKS